MSNSWQHLNGIKEWYDSSFTAICISGIRSHGGPSEEDFSTTSLIPTCKLWTNASICYLVCRFSLCVSFISVRLLHSFANVPNLTVKRKQSAKLLFVCLFVCFLFLASSCTWNIWRLKVENVNFLSSNFDWNASQTVWNIIQNNCPFALKSLHATDAE